MNMTFDRQPEQHKHDNHQTIHVRTYSGPVKQTEAFVQIYEGIEVQTKKEIQNGPKIHQ